MLSPKYSLGILCIQLPGKKRFGPSGWSIQAKLQIFMWLGILKHKKYVMQGLPDGYEYSQELKNLDRPRALPPSFIHYTQKHVSPSCFLGLKKFIKI